MKNVKKILGIVSIGVGLNVLAQVLIKQFPSISPWILGVGAVGIGIWLADGHFSE